MRTTTYRGRHTELLRVAAALIARPKDRRLRVLEVGPGLAVKAFGRRAGYGTPGRALAKAAETLVRRLPLPDSWYENYESEDILEAFGPADTALTILDVNPRTLRVIASNLAGRGIVTVPADLADAALADHQALKDRFDVVVALATVGRIAPGQQARAVDNLIALTLPGGLVIEDGYDLARRGPVERCADGAIYRKRPDRSGGQS